MFSGSVDTYRPRYLAFIYIALQIFIIGFILGGLINRNWVESDASKEVTYYSSDDSSDYSYESYTVDFDSFSGGVLACFKGCGQTERYNEISYDACENDNSDEVKTICSTMKILSSGGTFKIIFDVLTLILVILWFSFMVCPFKNRKCFKATYCFSASSCIVYYVGSLGWFGITSASFSNCSDSFPDDGEKLILCAVDGPAIIVTLMVIYPFIVTSYVIFAIKANKNRPFEEVPPQIELVPQGIMFIYNLQFLSLHMLSTQIYM